MINTFKVMQYHFHLFKENVLVIQGYFPFDNRENYILKLKIDNAEVSFSTNVNSSNEVRRRYIDLDENVSEEYLLEVDLCNKLESLKNLTLLCAKDGQEEQSLSLNKKEILQLKEKYIYNIDSSVVGDDNIRIIGWTAGKEVEEFHLFEGQREVEIQVKRGFRKDVVGVYQELDYESQPGFEITFKKDNYKNLQLYFIAGGKKYDCKINTSGILSGGNPVKKDAAVLRVLNKIRRDGIQSIAEKIGNTIKKSPESFTYMDFVKKNKLSQDEIISQRQTKFEREPLFSIVVPLYKTPEKYLYALVDSIIDQTYKNFELILADGSPDDKLGKLLKDKYGSDARVIYHKLEGNGGISDNTNAAMELAKGEFIVLSDHDDTLAINALFECAKAINLDPAIDVIYSDEDKVAMDQELYFDPSFKPDFNLDYLCSVNYICHLFVFKRSLYQQIGGLRKEFDGAQDHDFILRCVEVADKVHHIPKVLYHWRCHIDSTAMNLESKLYALDNGAKAVTEHYKRCGIPAVAERGEFYGTYKTRYNWEENPLVSIVIPTKDHHEDLKKCISSIMDKSSYRNIEFIVVENNSTEKETFEYYESLKKYENVKIVTYKGDFNFSAINNFGVEYASGQYILLLNNDTEIINDDCIKELLHVTMRPDVGICGALLYYPDDSIQHAGVTMGVGGIAGHSFVGVKRSEPGYMFRAVTTQDLTCVTAACLMIKKTVFDQVGGLTESLKVAFNDVDLCLKVREKGYLVVYNPNAELYHYESKSRGYEDSAIKQARFNAEIEELERLWPDILKKGDPYYNANLSLVDGGYRLKE